MTAVEYRRRGFPGLDRIQREALDGRRYALRKMWRRHLVRVALDQGRTPKEIGRLLRVSTEQARKLVRSVCA